MKSGIEYSKVKCYLEIGEFMCIIKKINEITICENDEIGVE